MIYEKEEINQTNQQLVDQGKVKRNVKDSLFHIIFRKPEVQLSLYNAFIISDYLYMVEQQSTLCGNMPLRHLVYVADEYKMLVDKKRTYYKKTLKINNPKFIVFYNGQEEKESQWEERLSEAYYIEESEPSLELKVTFYNINEGHNEDLKEKCLMLKEYSVFIDRIHYYENEGHIVKEATELAIKDCIKEGILTDYLEKERDKIMSCILDVYVTAEEIALMEANEDGYERGRIEGETRGIKGAIELLVKAGIPQEAAIIQVAEQFALSPEEVMALDV